MLGAILVRAPTARLTKALVFDEQAAASVNRPGRTRTEDVGEFMVTITPRPGHSLSDLEIAADAVIERLKSEGPTAEEVQKATAGEELSFVRGLESNLGKAFQLANGAAIHGDPGYFRTEYQKTLAVTAADVQRVANKYLTSGPRRAERRADGTDGSGIEAGRKHRGSNEAPESECLRRAFAALAFACSCPALVGATTAVARAQALDRTKTAPDRQDAGAARADLDESDAATARS